MGERAIKALVESAKRDLEWVKKNPLATQRWDGKKFVDIPHAIELQSEREAKAEARLNGYQERLQSN